MTSTTNRIISGASFVFLLAYTILGSFAINEQHDGNYPKSAKFDFAAYAASLASIVLVLLSEITTGGLQNILFRTTIKSHIPNVKYNIIDKGLGLFSRRSTQANPPLVQQSQATSSQVEQQDDNIRLDH